MIDDLLKEFPESKDSYEYQDYLRNPNKGNASEFITRTIEENLDQVDKRENYVQYIAKRPRVEKTGTHGLFTDENVPVHLNQVAEEVASHQGILMTQILSLRREDAARLGYEKGEAWRTLIRNHTKDMLVCPRFASTTYDTHSQPMLWRTVWIRKPCPAFWVIPMHPSHWIPTPM